MLVFLKFSWNLKHKNISKKVILASLAIYKHLQACSPLQYISEMG